jgi:hypothetical protein
MFGRIRAITLNAYREAARARILFGLFGAALVTTALLILMAEMALREPLRVVADLGTASMSLYAVLVSIIIGATSLHREVELKTLFPILTRELRRHEYLLGKFLGTIATLVVFLAVDGAAVLSVLGAMSGVGIARLLIPAAIMFAILGVGLVVVKHGRVFLPLPWSVVLYVVMAIAAGPAGGERQLVLAQNALTLAEVSIVTAFAMLFSSFSSPFLTGVFTLGMFVMGRSTDTLRKLPLKMVGPEIRAVGSGIAHVVPNLHIYVPPRPLLLGAVSDQPTWPFVAAAWGNAALYTAILLTLATLIFKRRDFL